MKILREDDDEEIGHGIFQQAGPQDIILLAKKRRIEYEVGREGASEQRPGRPVEAGHDNSANRGTETFERSKVRANDFISAAQKLQDDQTSSEAFGLLMGETFSAGNALDNFLELRGIKKQKLTSSSHFIQHKKHAQAQDTTQAQPQPAELAVPPLAHKADPLPVPTLRIPVAPISVIVSSNVLKNRKLIRHIELQLPGLKLIERDFTAHNTVTWLPNSVTRSPISSPLDSEADLIVSPFTGIILTTLQKIKQKPLPGQKTKPAIRSQLEKVSLRYEKLVVLVSEGRVDESTNGLDKNDCNAFSEFVGFALGLDATVTVQFVGGGEETLFKWLVNSIVQHAATESSLLEEETHWELFLRRAGMNAFAAQSITAAIKATETGGLVTNKSGQSGLAAFVQMERQQRIDGFAFVCGRKLLERVSSCLDAVWD